LNRKKLALFLTGFALLAVCAAPPYATASICDSTAGNLIMNCGFETGDFTDWTVGGNTGDTSVSTGMYANSGTYGAALGPVGSDGTLTQSFTGSSTSYDLQFYLYSPGGTPNDFTVYWNGVDVGPDLLDAGSFLFTEYSYVLPGNVGSNTIEFSYRQDPSYWGLDDVIVTSANAAVPEPGSLALLLSGLAALGIGLRRRIK
jgi:hypothetical protein